MKAAQGEGEKGSAHSSSLGDLVSTYFFIYALRACLPERLQAGSLENPVRRRYEKKGTVGQSYLYVCHTPSLAL
jgi:hypothetical protein